MRCIVNLTQKQILTTELVAEGVVDLHQNIGSGKQPSDTIKKLLTFQFPPDQEEMRNRAREIAKIAADAVGAHLQHDDNRIMDAALIDGPAFMIPILVQELKNLGLKPLISFVGQSRKDMTEQPSRHVAFIEL